MTTWLTWWRTTHHQHGSTCHFTIWNWVKNWDHGCWTCPKKGLKMSPLSQANPNLHTSSLMPTTGFANPNPMSWPTSTNVKLGKFLVRPIVARLDIIEMKSPVFVVVLEMGNPHGPWEWQPHGLHVQLSSCWCNTFIVTITQEGSTKGEREKKEKNFLMSGLKMACQFSILQYKIMGKKLVI